MANRETDIRNLKAVKSKLEKIEELESEIESEKVFISNEKKKIETVDVPKGRVDDERTTRERIRRRQETELNAIKTILVAITIIVYIIAAAIAMYKAHDFLVTNIADAGSFDLLGIYEAKSQDDVLLFTLSVGVVYLLFAVITVVVLTRYDITDIPGILVLILLGSSLVLLGMTFVGILFLFQFLILTGALYLIIIPLAASVAINVAFLKISSAKSRLRAADETAIAEARSRDEAERKDYESRLARAKSEERSRIEREKTDSYQRIGNMKSQINGLLKEIHAIDCLAEKDLYLECVERLIDLISSRRADSIKEALQMYDVEREKKMNAEMRLAMDRMENRWREMKEDEDRRRRLDDAFRQLEENDRQRRIEKNLEDIKKRLSED